MAVSVTISNRRVRTRTHGGVAGGGGGGRAPPPPIPGNGGYRSARRPVCPHRSFSRVGSSRQRRICAKFWGNAVGTGLRGRLETCGGWLPPLAPVKQPARSLPNCPTIESRSFPAIRLSTPQKPERGGPG